MIITIDGPASAGKGTLAGKIAQEYKLAYFDTGMVYRAVGIETLLADVPADNADMAEKFAKGLTFQRMMELSKHPSFRGPEGGKRASLVSAIPSVRAALLKMQQDFCKNPTFADGSKAQGVVYDGRDTGTVVCPQADVKLFVIASAEARAQRRYKEYCKKGINTSYEEVLNDINQRDKRDSERSTSPLKPAADAIILDTTHLSIEEVFEKAKEIIDSHQKNLAI